MKTFKILGSGCNNCKTVCAMVQKAVQEMGIEAEIVKEEDMLEIIKSGVVSTPAILIDGKIVHSGGLPSAEDIKKWLE